MNAVEVPMALMRGIPRTVVITGTITTPPPMPNRPETRPKAKPQGRYIHMRSGMCSSLVWLREKNIRNAARASSTPKRHAMSLPGAWVAIAAPAKPPRIPGTTISARGRNSTQCRQ